MRLPGFEPGTTGLGDPRSTPLSYRRFGTGGRTRTCTGLVLSQMTLPLGYAGTLVGQVGFEPTGVPALETGAYAVSATGPSHDYSLARLGCTRCAGCAQRLTSWGDRRESNPSFQGHVLAGCRYTTTTMRGPLDGPDRIQTVWWPRPDSNRRLRLEGAACSPLHHRAFWGRRGDSNPRRYHGGVGCCRYTTATTPSLDWPAPRCAGLRPAAHSAATWWRYSDSNRDLTLCRRAALPA